MKRSLLVAALAAALALPAAAQTLRWASAGDPQTMDPYSQNENLTNNINHQVYEFLVERDKSLGFVPGLATEWKQTGPLQWRFKLRPGVKFHDGKPFTADDVVFSFKRAREKTSQIANYATAVGEPKKIDDLTVEFDQAQFDPVFLDHVNTVFIMSKAWCEEHNAVHPQDFTNKEETYTALHANGTGPFVLEVRQPDVKTVLKRNPAWWGKFEGNVQEVVYRPIANDATRVAALISGDVDFILDPPPRDVAKLQNTPNVKVVQGPENRIVFIGMDQARDELLYSSVKGKNPFKDQRVRKALYQAIDIDTVKTKLMNGEAAPTGAVVPSPLGTSGIPEAEKRLPYDLEAAKKLMKEAGYADGFEVTLDCPNNRYINDERICQTLAAMWAKLNVKVRVNAMPKTIYFPKLDKLDTSLYMLGWGGSITDPETVFTPIYRNRAGSGIGAYNYGNYKDDTLDALVASSSKEADPVKRKALIKQVLERQNEQVHYLPLHRQFIPWAMRTNVTVVHRPDNWPEMQWAVIK